MAVTYSSTLLGKYTSVLSASLASSAGAASETITLVHGLGASPHFIAPYLRSTTTGASAPPIAQVTSWNASVATIVVSGGGAYQLAQVSSWDIVAQVIHTLVQ